MGSRSKSRQSNADRRIAATGGSQVAAEGSKIVTNIETADPEVLETALEESFGFGKTALGGAFGFGEKALEQVTDSNRRAVEAFERDQASDQEFFDAVVDRGSEELEGLKGLLSTTAIVGVAAFAAFAFSRS